MKLLLIEAPWTQHLVDGSDRTLPSLGIGYLVSSVQLTAHDVDVMVWQDENPLFAQTIKDSGAEIIGISCTTDTFIKGIEIAERIKSLNAHMPIILGGVHATIIGGEAVLRNWTGLFDYVIEGEGEISLPLLLESLDTGDSVANIPGVSCWDGEEIKRMPPTLIERLDDLPFPDRNKLIAPRRYDLSNYGLDISVMTSRGCSYKCSFCSVGVINSHTWRRRSVQNVILEIEDLVNKYGMDFFLHFVDDNFFVDSDRALEILKIVYSRWPKIKTSFATRSDLIIKNAGMLPQLKRIGVVSIELGIENGSQSVLNRYAKGTTVYQNGMAVQLLKQHDIEAGIDYIMFDHYTTIEDLQQNINFLREYGLWGHYPPVVYSSLVLYPGTRVAENWHAASNKAILIERGTPIEFVNSGISIIHETMHKLSKLQPRMYQVLKRCKEMEQATSHSNVIRARIVAKHISLIPYLLLETLCSTYVAQGSVDQTSEIQLSKIEKEINEIEILVGLC